MEVTLFGRQSIELVTKGFGKQFAPAPPEEKNVSMKNSRRKVVSYEGNTFIPSLLHIFVAIGINCAAPRR